MPYFLNLTTFFSFMPVRKDIVEKYGDGWEKNPKTCISNGPFVLESYKIGDNLTIAKNPKYYDSKNVKIDKVKWYSSPTKQPHLTRSTREISM